MENGTTQQSTQETAQLAKAIASAVTLSLLANIPSALIAWLTGKL